MILLDSTILIEYFRFPKGRLPPLFTQLRPSICGVSRAEILHGARNPSHLSQLKTAMDQLPQVSVPSDIWDELGANLCVLRTNGLTVPFADAMIATIAMRYQMEVWTYDKHYSLIQKLLPSLRLFQEPP